MDRKTENLWDSQEILDAYEKDNYKVVNLKNDSDICIIFFSSNGLYYPNTVKEFQEKILVEDSYEWENVATSIKIQKHVGRIIFIRDIYKQWYVKGISNKYHSIEGLYQLLRKLTEGFQVITAGGSSGGYASVILGLKLGAVKIYSFSGQFSIWDEVDDYFLLDQYRVDKRYSYYYDLEDMLMKNEDIPIYYFYPARCKQDVQQYTYTLGKNNIYTYAFDYDTHATTMMGCNFPYVLLKTNDRLINLYQVCKNRMWKKNQFLAVSAGIISYIYEKKIKMFLQKQEMYKTRMNEV